MEKARFGRYQYIVLTLCGLVMASISGPGSSLQENRPIIACDLMISHNQRMRIDMYIIIALVLGGLAIAIPGDFISRLKSLVVSLIFYGSCTMALGFCTEYYCFTIFSVFKAFWASALLPVMMVYVVEVQTARCRGASLCFLQIFWLVGLVAMPVLSIGWRSSQFIFGILALVATVPTARYFTESPRFLLSLGREEDALKCLKKIYERNFPKSEKEYPVKKLTDDFSPKARDALELRTYIPKVMRPPWYCPIVVLQTGFVFQLCYFTMSYWFPEMQCRHVLLFRIMRRKVICKFGEKSLEDKYLPPRDLVSNFCTSINIDVDYYKEVSTISLVALTFLIWIILRVDYIGRTYFLTLGHIIAGLSSFLVHFVIGTKYRLFYTCLMGAMWVISSTMSSCLAIEFFKTRYRVFGVGLVNSFGYAGMAMGMYGLLLKGGAGCIAIISVTGILVTVAGLLTLSLPDIKGIHLK